MKLLVVLSLFFSIQTTWADEMSPFEGLWTIDVDKTMESVKSSPKYDASEDEEFKSTITSMMKRMKLSITTDKVIYHIGQKQEVIALGKKVTSPSSVIAEVDSNGKKVTLTFTAVGEKHLNLKSSASHDMDYIIWGKAAPKASPPTELDVIADAINDSAKKK